MMAGLLPALTTLVSLVLVAMPAQANGLRSGCPLIVPQGLAELQPLRIPANQVAAKNARGCLSPADGIYGADGCPLRLCGSDAGVIQLPPLP
jgi:hypothetical protein